MNAALAANQPHTVQPCAAALGPALFAATSDRYYKVSAEALRACVHLVRVIRPVLSEPVAPGLQPLVEPLFVATTGRLAAQDQDQEVKEAAIACAATLVASLGDHLPGQVQQVRFWWFVVYVFDTVCQTYEYEKGRECMGLN